MPNSSIIINGKIPIENNTEETENNTNSSFQTPQEKTSNKSVWIYFLIASIITILVIITFYNIYRFHHHMQKHKKKPKRKFSY